MAQREAEFQGIRSRIAAHNGVRATRQQTGGTTGGILWHENKIPDVCTLETTQNDLSTANPLWYSSEVYRIDLRLVKNVYSHNTFPGLTLVYISSTPTKYSSYNDPKFAGSQQSYNRKSTAKPFLPYMAPQAVQQSWVIPFTTHDAKLAAKFVEDVNALAAMCRASK